jgi:hypothetical protein
MVKAPKRDGRKGHYLQELSICSGRPVSAGWLSARQSESVQNPIAFLAQLLKMMGPSTGVPPVIADNAMRFPTLDRQQHDERVETALPIARIYRGHFNNQF